LSVGDKVKIIDFGVYRGLEGFIEKIDGEVIVVRLIELQCIQGYRANELEVIVND
jgi:transcription antitermination factor NusG